MANQSFLAMSLSQRSLTLVVIDPSVENYPALVAGVERGAQVVLLAPDQDGVAQVTAAIAQYRPQSVHLIAHGAPGCLYLGNGELSLDTLPAQAEVLAGWFETQADPQNRASLVLYGCRVAAGDAGEAFVEKLHGLTGAGVFASTQPVGASDRGGSWQLDVARGQGDQRGGKWAIAPATRQAYSGVLGWVVSQKVTSDYAPPVDQNNNGQIDNSEIESNPANDLVSDEEFGRSVAMYGNSTVGNYAVVGVPRDNPVEGLDELSDPTSLGAVYIYQQQQDGTWAKVEEIKPDDDPNTLGPDIADSLIPDSVLEFGSAVAISGEGSIVRIAVGDPEAGRLVRPQNSNPNDPPILQTFGAVYVYERDFSAAGGGTWTQTQVLSNAPSSDNPLTLSQTGGVDSRFGSAVSIAPDGTVVVGAPEFSLLQDQGNIGFGSAGKVYVYDVNGELVDELIEQELTEVPPNSPINPANNRFGTSVAIDAEKQIVVGVPGGDHPRANGDNTDPINGASGIQSGTAYVYSFEGDSWSNNRQQLVSPFNSNAISEASNFASQFGFGSSVSISGDYAIIGAPEDDTFTQNGNAFLEDKTDIGSAYIFQRQPDGSWVQVQRLQASDNKDPSFEQTPRGERLEQDNDLFGYSVSMSGEYAIVGAVTAGEYTSPYLEATGQNPLVPGAAYIFQLVDDPENPGQKIWQEVDAIRSVGQPRFDELREPTDPNGANLDSFGRDTGERSFGEAVAIYQDPITRSVSAMVGASTDGTVIGQDDSTGDLAGEPDRRANDPEDLDATGAAYFLIQRPEVIDVIFNDRTAAGVTEPRGDEDIIVSDADTGPASGFTFTIVYNQSMDPTSIPDVQFFLDAANENPPAGEPNQTLGALIPSESRWIEIDGRSNSAYVATFVATDLNVEFGIDNPQFDLEIDGARSAAGVAQVPATSPELDFLTDVFTIDTLNPSFTAVTTLNTSGQVVSENGFFSGDRLTVSGSFSEFVNFFTAGAVVGPNFAYFPETFTVDQPTFNFAVDPINEGVFELFIPEGTFIDRAGNFNERISLGNRTYDITGPEVTALLPGTIAGPVPDVGINGPFVLTVQFSDNLSPDILGFEAVPSDFVLTNGEVSNVQFSETVQQTDGTFLTTYTLTVSPTANILGTQGNEIGVAIAAGAVTDLAGNPNAASQVVTVRYDDLRPTITSLVGPQSDPGTPESETEDAVFTVTATFSEVVQAALFDTADISVTNGTVTSVVADVNDPTRFFITIEAATPGPVIVSVVDAATKDAVGNDSIASTPPLSVEYNPRENLPPVVTITDVLLDAEGNPVTDPALDVDVQGDQTLTFTAGSGNSIVIDDEGTNTLTVTLSVDPTRGRLSLNPIAIPALTFTVGDGTDDSTLTFEGLEADINAALEGMIFDPANVDAAAEINITVTDKGFPDLGLAPLSNDPAPAIATINIERVLTDAAHDFDGNGTSDLIWRDGNSTFIWFLDSDGTAVSVAQQDQNNPFAIPGGEFSTWEIRGSGSFNDDAFPDLVLREPGGNRVAIARTTVTGGPLPEAPVTAVEIIGVPEVVNQTKDANWSIRGVGDFNGDQQDDLLWRNQATGETVVWYMNDAQFVQEVSFGITIRDPRWQIEAVGDFNSDLAADVVWRNSATGQNLIWFTNGVTVIGAGAIEPLSPNWSMVGSGDYNGDQISDLVFRDRTTGANQIWLMNGANVINKLTIDPLVSNAQIVQN